MNINKLDFLKSIRKGIENVTDKGIKKYYDNKTVKKQVDMIMNRHYIPKTIGLITPGIREKRRKEVADMVSKGKIREAIKYVKDLKAKFDSDNSPQNMDKGYFKAIGKYKKNNY